jgi:hypothetical protein
VLLTLSDVHCDCSHACRLVGDEKSPQVECYCPPGYELSEDQKTCRQVESAEKEFTIVQVGRHTSSNQNISDKFHRLQVTPPADTEGEPHTPSPAETTTPISSSPLPTDAYGQAVVTVSTRPDQLPYPTDSLGRRVIPIVLFNGTALRADDEGNHYDPLGRQVVKDDDEVPLDPTGARLRTNAAGSYVYPPLDKSGNPLPTDSNLRPLHTVVDSDGTEFPKDAGGRSLDAEGRPFPTDFLGQPVGIDASPVGLAH